VSKVRDGYFPREKAKNEGIEKLSDSELLALIFRTGSKDYPFDALANDFLRELGNISKLKDITYDELTKFKGISKIKALTILGSIELGKRIENSHYLRHEITYTADNAFRYIKPYIIDGQESVFIILIDIHSKIFGQRLISKGTLSGCDVMIRDIFKKTISENAYAICIVHNHPSEHLLPSNDDIMVTKQIIACGKMMDIIVIDHLIVTNSGYISITKFIKEKTKS